MEKTIENGYEEVTFFVRRTRQMEEYEPLVAGASVKKMVKSEERNKIINNGLIEIEEEVMDFLFPNV